MTLQSALLSFLILAEMGRFTGLILVQLNLAFLSFRLHHEGNSKKKNHQLAMDYRAERKDQVAFAF